MSRALLWKQVTETLVAELRGRRFKAGERFHSLKELSRRFGVSEITGRRVMDELQGRALIERIQGKGSFVRRTAVGRDLTVLMDPALMQGSFSHVHLVQEILQGMTEQALAAHCRLRFVSPSYVERHAGPDDLIASIWHSRHQAGFGAIVARGLRAVVAHAPRTVPGIATVRPDFAGGMRLATAHLVAKGHRRIALIAGEVQSLWYQARFDGYYQALKEHGLSLDLKLVKETGDESVGHADPSPAMAPTAPGEVERALGELLALADPPTAVVCANDGRALQLLRACRARRVRVPRDLAVIGFDNHHEGALAEPALTTIDQFWRQQGREAVAVLLRAAEDPARAPEDVVIAPALVERASVRSRPLPSSASRSRP